MKKIISLMVLLAIMLVPTLVMAASPWVDKPTYSEKVVGKLQFGFKNAFLGPFELFYEPHAAQVDHKNAWMGLGKGLIYGILDTAGGAIHAVTFLIPVDVPLPDNGVHFDK